MNNPTLKQSYYIQTYGCQMNVSDTEVMEAVLEQMNFTKASCIEEAGIILFNTCCVRENADLKVYGRLGELKENKRKNPNLIIGVIGCLSQKDGSNFLKRFPYIDLVLGTYKHGRLPYLIQEVIAGKGPILELSKRKDRDGEDLPVKRENEISAYVPISYGCDQFCAFCIVPFVRGKQRSRHPKALMKEVQTLAESGYKEITLLGQNVNTYGFDLGPEHSFDELLKLLDGLDEIERIRYTTSHPKFFPLELVDTIARLKKVCEHFHLPLQSGDDEVLKRMRRGYTYNDYKKLVHRIRALIPHASITTDLIVGFPGETEEQFQKTLEAYQEIQFDQAFMFSYSPREKTRAAAFENQIPELEKKERLHRLIACSNKIVEKKNKDQVGTTQEILVEGFSKKNANRLTGRTRTNRIVVFDGSQEMIGTLQKIHIENGYSWGLEGNAAVSSYA
ncbi:MAG: tRNA (N6-isopentenyl adenosine(37)-C2)-methylthiotransferase MiaB [Candidatus Eremiobacteraeota bacterium]|nr:tRNA (N6-isopentenyl adenosine(37)-C2)-methylthiotransferase MiaB [Candidatus Eremiobacteraeota bacterium]MCL5054658.1 tRNA (N6-isopentenyl adenosine(37)-C2)-methylthiotransferase MiaB [Bacillota bacterium]